MFFCWNISIKSIFSWNISNLEKIHNGDIEKKYSCEDAFLAQDASHPTDTSQGCAAAKDDSVRYLCTWET